MGERLGETVGYQVRFEEVSGPGTRLKFVTEGILTRRMISDPELRGIDVVVLDEFHERHLETDLALALLKRVQRKRPELRIVVMSATLDADPVSRHLGNCPVIRSHGRLFDVEVTHLPYSPLALEEQLRNAVELLLREKHAGNILAFLPGAAEIRRASRACEKFAASGMLVVPLHGSLSPDEQDRAISPAEQQKLILSTNVAESSVTVEGVTAVIDSGLARVASYSHWTGMPTLHIARVSQASVKQRSGRAGRTGPGRAIRLFSKEDYLHRPQQTTAEIVRSDLSQLCLDLRAMGIADPRELQWLDPPPNSAIEQAQTLLDRLGATGAIAEQMGRYPVPPRLSRVVVEALERGVGEDACVVAAMLASGTAGKHTDLLHLLESPRDYRTTQQIEQIRRIARPPKQKQHIEDTLLLSVLSGFPDLVARRRSGKQLLLSNGGSAEIIGEPPAYEFMVVLDAEDRKDKPLPIVRMTARIEPEWLIELFPDHVREESGVTWNRAAERVDALNALRYDALTIQESASSLPNPHLAADLLFQKAIEAGIERFINPEALDEFAARAQFAGLPVPGHADALRDLCFGVRSFSELRKSAADLIPALERKIGTRQLNELAPAYIQLPNGRRTRVHYEHDKQPWIASRLQDFFGMSDTPKLGPKRTPVVVHLLAPSQRPVQTTTDLAGFWERLYPQVRRELMRRYPKHKWPERPSAS